MSFSYNSFTLVRSDKKYHLYPVLITLTKQHLWVCVFFCCFCFVLFYYKWNQVSVLKNSPLFSTSPEYYFGMVIKQTKLTYYSKCLPLCKINYIHYNASHTALYLCNKIKKIKKKKGVERAKQSQGGWEKKTWGWTRRRGIRSKEISKTINTHFLKKKNDLLLIWNKCTKTKFQSPTNIKNKTFLSVP